MEKVKPVDTTGKSKTPPVSGKAVNKKAEKAKEAQILSEEKDENNVSSVEPNLNTEQKEQNTNQKENKEKNFVESTQTITVEDDKQEDKTAKVNFMNNDFMKDFIGKKTEKSKEEPGLNDNPTKDSNTTTATTQESVQQPLQQGLSPDDFQEFARVFMEVLDLGIAQLLRFYAKDNSTEAYELPKGKIDRLSKQLGNLFVKYNTKFSLEFMFIVTLCIMYSGPISVAKARKKEIKENGGVVPKREGRPRKSL